MGDLSDRYWLIAEAGKARLDAEGSGTVRQFRVGVAGVAWQRQVRPGSVRRSRLGESGKGLGWNGRSGTSRHGETRTGGTRLGTAGKARPGVERLDAECRGRLYTSGYARLRWAWQARHGRAWLVRGLDRQARLDEA
jgi:hypothetical protein